MKLGELLIRESVITQAELDEALNSQLVYGGSLGTCLVELGYIDERSLGKILSLAFGIDYAPPEAFYEIAPFAIDALPAKLAEKNLTIPLGLTKRALSVAMSDPTDLGAIDELRFVTGYSITAYVAAEVRIYQALERYYHLPRRLRYVRLCDQIEKAVLTPGSAAAADHDLGRSKGWSGRRSESTRIGSSESEPAAPIMPHDSATSAPMGSAGSATAILERPAVPAPQTEDGVDPLADVIDKMCRVKDESVLGQVLLGHLAKTFERSVLFQVTGNFARVWDSQGIDTAAADLESVKLHITSEPVFRLMAGQRLYAGAVPTGPRHAGFFEKLGIRSPREMLLVPAYLNDRLVALVYADNGAHIASKGIPKDTAVFSRLSDKLALGIGLVDLKRRLREI